MPWLFTVTTNTRRGSTCRKCTTTMKTMRQAIEFLASAEVVVTNTLSRLVLGDVVGQEGGSLPSVLVAVLQLAVALFRRLVTGRATESRRAIRTLPGSPRRSPRSQPPVRLMTWSLSMLDLKNVTLVSFTTETMRRFGSR